MYFPDTPNSPPHLWAVIAVVSFSASNVAEAVPLVFKYALDDLVRSQTVAGTPGDTAHQEQLLLARKIREAILQSGFLSGAPRAINSLLALQAVTPEHLRESKLLRDTHKPPAEWAERGEELFTAIYQDTASSVQGLVNAAYPDLDWYCTTVGYGMTYGGTDVLSALELIYVMIASLIAVDAPRQIVWHLANVRRAGASVAEVRAVRKVALDVSGRVGIRWRGEVPDVEE